MVRSAKKCLRKLIGQAKHTDDEMILNSQLLMYDSANDFEELLTPLHLLIGRRVMSLPDPVPSNDSDDEVTADQLSRRSRHLNITLNQIWKRLRNEYLLELREAHRHNKGIDAIPVEVGDVVVHSDNQPRGFWKLAQVERTTVLQGKRANFLVLLDF